MVLNLPRPFWFAEERHDVALPVFLPWTHLYPMVAAHPEPEEAHRLLLLIPVEAHPVKATSWFRQQELKHSQPTRLPFPYRCFHRDGVGGAERGAAHRAAAAAATCRIRSTIARTPFERCADR